jgi:hypothetical protein
MVYTHNNGDVYVILGMVYGIVLTTFSMLHVWYSPPIHPQNAPGSGLCSSHQPRGSIEQHWVVSHGCYGFTFGII